MTSPALEAAVSTAWTVAGEHPAPLIEAIDVTKFYRHGTQTVSVIQGASFTVQRGEYIALMGPSGSGKTTLLNLVAGIDRPSAGRIVIDGTDIAGLGETALADWRSRSVGFIFQFYNLIPVLTALQNIELPLLMTRLSRRERRAHAMAALQLVGLADRSDHLPNELSGGQQQRVAIARAVVTDPVMLVADEPTGDLDRKTGNEVLDLLDQLHSNLGKTILMVTHDPQAAARAQRELALDAGRVVRGDTAAHMPRLVPVRNG